MPQELLCETCRVWLQADTETELVEFGSRHGLSIHGRTPSPEYLLARIQQHNQ